jgi:hypothetical protein
VVHHVFLVPGFFGFSELGALPYFAHVAEYLTESLQAQGVPVRVLRTATQPTGALSVRAAHLRAAVEAARPRGPIHLVGHSSGALDARLLVATAEDAPWLPQVQSVVSINGPHRGTPLAAFFSGIYGHKLLGLLSLATIHVLRFGGLPLGMLAKMVGVFARLDDVVLRDRTVLDQLAAQLLSDFSRERRGALRALLQEVRTDQDLIPQLAPSSMAHFDRETPDRPGVNYGCVVCEGRRPGLKTAWRAGFNPYAQLTHSLYSALHRLSVRYRAGLAPQAEAPSLTEAFGRRLDWQSSDGVVPSLSQLHGTLIHAATADHLDVVGHFEDRDHFPPHYDWLSSGSGFRRADFERLWGAVVDFLLRPRSTTPSRPC